MPEDSTTTKKARETGKPRASDDYVVPVVHLHIPSAAVNAGFWGGLAGSVALGVIEPPLGMFVGAGRLIARHQSKK
jgi:hypothetical protein